MNLHGVGHVPPELLDEAIALLFAHTAGVGVARAPGTDKKTERA